MKLNLICKVVMLAAIAAVGSLRADSTENNNGSKTVKLFVREVPITVLGMTVKVATIDLSDGVQGFNPEQSDGFHDKTKLELENPLELGSAGALWREMTDGLIITATFATWESSRRDERQ